MNHLRQSFPSASWVSERFSWALRCLLVAVVLVATQMGSAVAAPVTDTDREQARRLVKLGDERFAAGDFAGAHEAYQGADLIMRVPTTGLQVARAELALGKLIEARRTLERVVAHVPEEGEPEAFVDAREAAAGLVEDVRGRIPTITIDLIGVPGGQVAWVSLNGEKLAEDSPGKPQAVNPGKHEVAAGVPGNEQRSRAIVLAEGEHKRLQIDLTPPPPPPDPKPRPFVVSPLVWVGFAVAGAGTIVGAVTGGVSLSLASEVREVCFEGRICPSSAEDKRDRSLALAHTSTVSFAIAGVGSLLGIVGFLISGRDDPAQVTLRVSPGAVVLSASF